MRGQPEPKGQPQYPPGIDIVIRISSKPCTASAVAPVLYCRPRFSQHCARSEARTAGGKAVCV